jgi:hypothetical protein
LQTKNSIAFESDVVNQNSAAEEEGEVVIGEMDSKLKKFDREPSNKTPEMLAPP